MPKGCRDQVIPDKYFLLDLMRYPKPTISWTGESNPLSRLTGLVRIHIENLRLDSAASPSMKVGEIYRLATRRA